jgi:hypothetical protein
MCVRAPEKRETKKYKKAAGRIRSGKNRPKSGRARNPKKKTLVVSFL